MMNQRKRSRNKGQSLSEYGLAIGLVVIVGIVSLTLIGQQTSDLLGNTITKRKPTLISTAFQAGPNTAFLEAFPDITLKSPSGKSYTLPNYPATSLHLRQLIETTGGNGADYFAQFLRNLSELEAPDLISKEEQDQIRELANAGFNLARLQHLQKNSMQNKGIADLNADEKNTSLDLLPIANALSYLTKVKNNIQSAKFKNENIKSLINDAGLKITQSGQVSMKISASLLKKNNSAIAETNNETSSLVNNSSDYFNSLLQSATESYFETVDKSDSICSNSLSGESNIRSLECYSKSKP